MRRLTGIGLLAIRVAAALYAAGMLNQPSYAFSMFGAGPIPVKALLATIVPALAGIQVLIALWIYRKLLIVHSRRLPGWALPVAGGAMAVIIGVLWYTSTLWYYDGYQLPAL